MLSKIEQLILLGLASKAVILSEQGCTFHNDVERLQFDAAAIQVRPILARVDEENPGVMPVPHDGVEWKDR